MAARLAQAPALWWMRASFGERFVFDAATQIMATLALAAFIAGFVDSIAGGGGLISVPALLLAGLSPVDALGTNKLQGLFGSASATIAYSAKGHVDLREQAPSALLAFLGGALGAGLAAILPGEMLRLVLPFVLIGIALFFAFKPNLGNADSARRLSPLIFGATIVPAIGFYDGVFGPGAGSFFMLAFVTLAGYGLLKATAHTKLLNFSSNTGGFFIFALAGVVHWKIGLVMGVCQFLGARVGASLAMRGGAKVIKPLLVLSCIALAVRLLMDPAHPLRTMLGL